MAFEGYSYDLNTALKFHNTLYHAFAYDNPSFMMQQMITRIMNSVYI